MEACEGGGKAFLADGGEERGKKVGRCIGGGGVATETGGDVDWGGDKLREYCGYACDAGGV